MRKSKKKILKLESYSEISLFFDSFSPIVKSVVALSAFLYVNDPTTFESERSK